jgi:dTDP-4-dehydrorhamnose reductase
VDGCARDPDLAWRRNTHAVGLLAEACVRRGTDLLLVSTNEVFDGERADGLGYREADGTGPRNSYGASKLRGEDEAREAYLRAGAPRLWIVRTAWLYGPAGNDFPTRILAASDRRAPGEPLPVVTDEHGSPTFTQDLATAIMTLVSRTTGGVYHLVNPGAVSRFQVAEHVLRRLRPGRELRPISRTEFPRDSDPPPWAVLDGSTAADKGVTLRPWSEALDAYLDQLDSTKD